MWSSIPQWIPYFLEEHLQWWIAYIQCIWQIFLFKAFCYFKGVLAAIHLSGTVIISGGHLQWSSIFKGTVFLWNKYLQSSFLSKVLYRGKFHRGKVTKFWAGDEIFHGGNIPIFPGIELIRNSSCRHPLDEWLFFYYKRNLQPCILLNLLCSCRAGVVVKRYRSYELWYLLDFRHVYILKDSIYLTTSIAAIHPFFYGTNIISWEHLKRSICQGHWVCFTTLITVFQYNKWSVVDSRKFEEYCVYLRNAIVVMLC